MIEQNVTTQQFETKVKQTNLLTHLEINFQDLFIFKKENKTKLWLAKPE